MEFNNISTLWFIVQIMILSMIGNMLQLYLTYPLLTTELDNFMICAKLLLLFQSASVSIP